MARDLSIGNACPKTILEWFRLGSRYKNRSDYANANKIWAYLFYWFMDELSSEYDDERPYVTLQIEEGKTWRHDLAVLRYRDEVGTMRYAIPMPRLTKKAARVFRAECTSVIPRKYHTRATRGEPLLGRSVETFGITIPNGVLRFA